ncbi:MAG: hypothetical protein KF773_11080 [Deltaproteobacteria bacterium]|nr:hypothetical protein [Deltaproteobacteria bacterium]
MKWGTGARIGDYVIERQLHGDAFVAFHAVVPRRVRIQVATTTSGDVEGALLREARVLETLRCAGVPRLFECTRSWIAVELVEGPTLGRGLGFAEAAALLRDVAAIVAHAHSRGVIHRSLRPEVIVPGAAPLVLGWGDARISGVPNASALTLAEDGLAYRAPELVTGDDHDERVDVFALGVVVYEAVSGRLPMAVPLARRCPAIPARLAELVDRMLLVDPLDRPNAAEVRAEAARIAEQLELPWVAPGPADAANEDVPVEVVELVELPDLHTPPPIPVPVRLRWTPPVPYEKTPPPEPVAPPPLRRGGRT